MMGERALLALCCYALISCVSAEDNGTLLAEAAGNSSATPSGAEEQSPTVSLFNTLVATMASVFIGFVCVRMQVIVPSRGDTKGFGFFVGQISYPVLIFKTVSTAQFGNVDMGTLGACTLGKVVVLVVTWLATFFGFKAYRGRPQKILTATVFAFYVVSSNDFALGFPVIQSLYKTTNMGIYVAGNSLVTSALFVPVTMVLLAIGSSLKKREQGMVQEEDSVSPLGQGLSVALDIIRNPVITMTIVALLYKTFLGFTLVDDGNGGSRLPEPLYTLVNLVAGPFGMCALFLTGTSLRSASVSFWPLLMVVMKVIICAYATYFFAGFLVGTEEGPKMQDTLLDFSFLYGMIPSSSAPLIFADQFDPASSEAIASAVLYGMVIAGPMMFVAALFLQGDGLDMSHVLISVEFTTILVSLVCGVIFLFVLAVLRREWGYCSAAKGLIAVYGVVLVIYEVVFAVFHPTTGRGPCEEYRTDPFSFMVILLGALQHACQYMLLALQVLSSTDFNRQLSMKGGIAMAIGGLAYAIALGFTVSPSLLQATCLVEGHPRILNLIEHSCVFLIISGLAGYRVYSKRAQRRAAIAAEGQADTSAETESDESMDSESPLHVEKQQKDVPDWRSTSPEEMVRTLIGVQLIRQFMELVNTSSLMAGASITGSFAEMLVLEALLRHGQLIILVAMLLTDESFSSHFVRVWSTVWSHLFGTEEDDKDMIDIERSASVSKTMSMVSRRVTARAY